VKIEVRGDNSRAESAGGLRSIVRIRGNNSDATQLGTGLDNVAEVLGNNSTATSRGDEKSIAYAYGDFSTAESTRSHETVSSRHRADGNNPKPSDD
jgi:hypothetical protein